MVKTIDFIVKSPKTFTNYLKKFSVIDNTALFEADLKDKCFLTKSPNEERSAVKYGMLKFNDSGFETSCKDETRIKIGVYSIPKLIKIIEQFGNSFNMTLKYDEIIGNNNQKDYAAISILLKKEDLKFNDDCTSLSIFKYISDELYTNTIRKIDSITTFELTKETIEQIRSLCELDKDHKLIEFKSKNGGIYAKGKSFEFLICTSSSPDASITFYKDQFDKVDVENCKVTMGSDRMLFCSLDTNTEIVISRVEGNENYDGKQEDAFAE